MKKAGIRHIIFDLGGVIVDLDTSLTVQQLAQMMGSPYEKALDLFHHDDRFKQHEKGELSDDGFREFIRGQAADEVSDEMIDQMWNAMILDLPGERIQLLKGLGKQYPLYLLSNTNDIHLDYVMPKLAANGIGSFGELFDTEYYSHRVGMRKPDPEIYEYVLKDRNIEASETLFFDDNPDNIRSAQSLGIQTFHVNHPNEIITWFNG